MSTIALWLLLEIEKITSYSINPRYKAEKTLPNNTYQYFGKFFEHHHSKLIFLTSVFCSGIVWLEHNCSNQKWIVTNKIVGLSFAYALAIGPLMMVTYIASNFFGPLNAHYCFFFHLFRGYIRSQFLFLLNSIIF